MPLPVSSEQYFKTDYQTAIENQIISSTVLLASSPSSPLQPSSSFFVHYSLSSASSSLISGFPSCCITAGAMLLVYIY